MYEYLIKNDEFKKNQKRIKERKVKKATKEAVDKYFTSVMVVMFLIIVYIISMF